MLCVCVCVSARARVHEYVYVYINTCVCVCVCVCVYMYACIYANREEGRRRRSSVMLRCEDEDGREGSRSGEIELLRSSKCLDRPSTRGRESPGLVCTPPERVGEVLPD